MVKFVKFTELELQVLQEAILEATGTNNLITREIINEIDSNILYQYLREYGILLEDSTMDKLEIIKLLTGLDRVQVSQEIEDIKAKKRTVRELCNRLK